MKHFSGLCPHVRLTNKIDSLYVETPLEVLLRENEIHMRKSTKHRSVQDYLEETRVVVTWNHCIK